MKTKTINKIVNKAERIIDAVPLFKDARTCHHVLAVDMEEEDKGNYVWYCIKCRMRFLREDVKK